MKELVINKNDAGQRLDRFVGKAIPLLPEALLQKYIRLKRIKVNGKGSKRDFRLSEGDMLQLYINDEFFDKPTEDNAYLKISTPHLDIVYEDDNIILVDKKPGILCHSAGEWDYNTLISNIKAYLYQKREWRPSEENSFSPALCNRIDRNTGGIVIAAKNAETLRIIDEKIRTREIDKFYLAAVIGSIVPKNGTFENYIFKDAKQNRVYVRTVPKKGAKRAITKYRTLAEKDGLSLMECELLTGRTHQIRAQFSNARHPLFGDGKYGKEIKNKSLGITGQALYSYKLRFNFTSSAGILDYLNGRTFIVDKVNFAQTLFNYKF